MLDQITPIVLTYNEAPNLGRTLEALRWARRVLVIDSGSNDETLAIARSFGNVEVAERRFDCFAAQWNFALALPALDSDWVLALDADYGVTDALRAELERLNPSADVVGYRARFRYCIDGVPLRGSLYPAVTVLFRREGARFAQDGHAYRVQLKQGRCEWLREPMLHDDRKPFARWLSAQERYANEEAEKLRSTGFAELRWPDRVRKIPFLAAPLVGLHCLAVKGCALDGRPGFSYAGQRVLAELILSLKLLER